MDRDGRADGTPGRSNIRVVIEPQLASLVDQPPEGRHWIHEIKHDGYRSLIVIEGGVVRVFTRNGYDWSDRYPGIIRAATNLRCKSAVMVRLLSRMLMEFPISRDCSQRSGRGPKTSSSTPSIFSILRVTT